MPLRYLLDTSVFSQPLRKRPHMPALGKWAATGDSSCAISMVTVGEIEFGLAVEENAHRRSKFDSLLRNRLQILPTEELVWHRFAVLKARQRSIAQPVSDLDLLIAATAIVHKLTLATLNRNDFSRIESLSWEDWSG
jgi:predicted nucleic acid-binding protein